MSKYLDFINKDKILDTESSKWIPKDESNRDYQEYLIWLEENEPDEDTSVGIFS